MEAGAMNPPAGNGGIGWRVERLEEERPENERAVKLADKHELELHGDRGLYAAWRELAAEMRRVKLALWALAVSITGAAIALVANLIAGGQHP